ncbi:beta-defensin 113 [Octodon degus]|uniref:Beta-defensin n=1 Tax=Octodon degus TaxID=10160 RepID=A0A6P6DV36_OCTDE|nr:beta-defensin 113 [Octodon degus]
MWESIGLPSACWTPPDQNSGTSVIPQKKTREIAERKRECYLVRGSCKSECNTWEYTYNYCNTEPCCVVREYQKPITETQLSTIRQM